MKYLATSKLTVVLWALLQVIWQLVKQRPYCRPFPGNMRWGTWEFILTATAKDCLSSWCKAKLLLLNLKCPKSLSHWRVLQSHTRCILPSSHCMNADCPTKSNPLNFKWFTPRKCNSIIISPYERPWQQQHRKRSVWILQLEQHNYQK